MRFLLKTSVICSVQGCHLRVGKWKRRQSWRRLQLRWILFQVCSLSQHGPPPPPSPSPPPHLHHHHLHPHCRHCQQVHIECELSQPAGRGHLVRRVLPFHSHLHIQVNTSSSCFTHNEYQVEMKKRMIPALAPTLTRRLPQPTWAGAARLVTQVFQICARLNNSNHKSERHSKVW